MHSFGAILFLVAFSIMLFAKYDATLSLPPPAKPVLNATKFILFAPMSFQTLIEFFQAIPTFMFAFTCHQNVFPIYNEAQNNSIKNMRNLVFLSVGIFTLIYIHLCYFLWELLVLCYKIRVLFCNSIRLPHHQQPWIYKWQQRVRFCLQSFCFFQLRRKLFP